MKAQLMLTCLCDALYGEVGIATVRVLEHAGIEVTFPENQTCCGQPAFNAGDWDSARQVYSRQLEQFSPDIAIVTPSTSCAVMMREGAHLLGLKSAPIFELSEFLLDKIDLDRWPLSGSFTFKRRKVVLHQACHGRALQLGDRPERFLKLIRGLEVIHPMQADQCCGFGGAFCVEQPHLSAGIGREKLLHLQETGVDVIAGTDMGCLMHLKGLQRKIEGSNLRFVHYAQLLAEAIG